MEKQLVTTLQENTPSMFFPLPDIPSPLRLSKSREARKLNGIVVGTLVCHSDSGEHLVDFPANISGGPLPARSAVPLGKTETGQAVVLMFEDSNPQKPIVMGIIQRPQATQVRALENTCGRKQNALQLQVDGERQVISAEREIVLRCGEASITLTRAGKILIRGAYVLSRSSGANRIKGASVQIN